MANVLVCAVCGTASSQKCSGCKSVFYCGKEHQKAHWKLGHKDQCKCYEIASNEVLGRFMRATRDIKCGEVILREPPLIYGPKVASVPVCLGCHRLLPMPCLPERTYYKCSKCGWPMCGPDCESSQHHIDECKLMSDRKFHVKIDCNAEQNRIAKKESAYCVIMPLRCILLKQRNPAKFRYFAKLEDHLTERIDTPLYKVMRANLVTFIRTILGLNEWDEEDIMRIAATLDTNAFDVRMVQDQRRMRAIYPSASMLSHDCVSNSRHVIDSDMRIIFMAKVPISKGEIISTSYTQSLKSTLYRRAHLLQAKCFACMCQRCSDPTELGTFAGAILCTLCTVGKIISTDPLDANAPWQCQLCQNRLTATQIKCGNEIIQKEIDELDKTYARSLELFLHRYDHLLHDKNTYALQVKYALIQLYGNEDGYQLPDMSDTDIARKMQLCRELLDVAEKLDGGWSRFRGTLLLHLQEVLFEQSKREFIETDEVARECSMEKLLESKQLLEEAKDILQDDPDMINTLKDRVLQIDQELDMY